MSGTGQLFRLAAQGQDVNNIDLVGTHLNLGAILGLAERALHDDQLDKLVERAEILVVLAKKHRAEHRLLEENPDG